MALSAVHSAGVPECNAEAQTGMACRMMGRGTREIVPSLLTQDTLNPSQYGIRIIAAELEPILDKLAAPGGPALPSLCCHLEIINIVLLPNI